MTYDTMNPVPSIDPRDLDDNAQAFDRFLQSTAASEPDRLGVQRKTWHQMELDAEGLVSPNVAALAAAVAAANKGMYFSAAGPVAMGTYDLSAFVRGISGSADQAAFRTAIGAISSTGSITGSAAKLTTPRAITATGDASWTVNFDGSAPASASLTLNTVPVAKGGTGGTDAASARTNLGVAFTAWTALTLSNGWTNTVNRRGAACRSFLNMVQLELQITAGTVTDGTTVATLPVGSRPAFQFGIPIAGTATTPPSASVGVPQVLVATDGTIKCYNCNGSISVSTTFATV